MGAMQVIKTGLISRAEIIRNNRERLLEKLPTLPRYFLEYIIKKGETNTYRSYMSVIKYKSADQSLRKRIQALPQELQDIVFDFCIFSRSTNDITYITNLTKPPLGLQINRKTRSKFARQYYGNGSIFEFSATSTGCILLCGKWLASLQSDHAQLLQVVKVQYEYAAIVDYHRSINWSSRNRFQGVVVGLRRQFLALREEILYVNQYYCPSGSRGPLDVEMWYNLRGMIGVEQVSWL
ncbi:hypothetical protein CLAFUW4_11799 [Fulvia fulva]|uniref:Uncharacterized protein n=1 Tax=Passalora fulva TaxID=5499 RepID=A0A9Q8PEP5_PASFU|nr:uncharacterized protein CLAFUR5_10842 [Fulvia fulva]KAK4617480.1 hypothetical protein CLAFUR4_11804 [Fulvia fulva]KAK4619216.1 hypothetical protein CLAFUR0_11817 [Fulvia fulva]UJO21079.1 hypothetical protein CLAFUR5_10842 [Fulvia fulva]WPV18075.1 hypothetical protein CLAFUW4_11799 [Fulvia fulva]WPV33022.1 hypothetical protein CLAFUW7_11806 [Fulvia fulva]